MAFHATRHRSLILLLCSLVLTNDAHAVPTGDPVLQQQPVQPVQPVIPSNGRHGNQLQATDQFSILEERSAAADNSRPCNHGNAAPAQPMQYFPPGPSGPVGAPGE